MTKIIRITTVPYSFYVLLSGQIKFLKYFGWEVLMVSSGGPEVNKVKEREKCGHVVIPLTRQITPLKDLIALYHMIKLFRKEKPDIVHSHTPKAGVISMLAAKLSGVPVRIHTVAGLPLQVEVGLKRKALEWVEQITYWAASEVWPNSHSLKSFIEIHNFAPAKKLKVIGKGSSNGIDLTEYSIGRLDPQILNDLKKNIQYRSNLVYLVFVGRVVADKGVNELVKVFARLENQYTNLRLLLVGPLEEELDPLDPEVLTTIRNNPNIFEIGFSDYVPYYMHLGNLFVFPSHREGFPNVVMQAALMNCPVICSNIGGNVDLVKHQKTGLLFEVADEEKLYYAVQYALEHMDAMKVMAKHLKTKVETSFNREYVHREILNNYHRLLAEKNMGGG